MLCKTTMRAALAHVLGIFGIFGVVGASAHEDAGSSQSMKYATEAMSGTQMITAASTTQIVLDVKLDTLIEGDADNNHYLVIDFGDAELAKDDGISTVYEAWDAVGNTVTVPLNLTGTVGDPTADPVVPSTTPELPQRARGIVFYNYEATEPAVDGNDDGDLLDDEDEAGTAGTLTSRAVTLARAFRGDGGDSKGVYSMAFTDDIPIDTHIRLELGTDVGASGALDMGAALLAISPPYASSYSATVYIYEELGDARAAARGAPPANYVYRSDAQPLFETGSSLATADAEVSGNLLTADVGHQNGPFLGFEADDDTDTTVNAGTLAMIMLEDDDNSMFLSPDGTGLGSPVLTGADIVVTSAVPGAFGFGVGAGHGANGEVAIEDDETTMDVDESNAGGAPTAFMISSSAACMDNPLMLSNAAGDAVDPNAEMDPVFSADATMGEASVTGNGPHYFCVLTENAAGKMNEVAIPIVPGSGPRAVDGYSIEVTTKAGDDEGPVVMGDGGAIERNGASLNITFLSLDPLYEQRLVIVNRSNREAAFWMDDGDFQSEPGTMISSKMGTDGISGTVGPGMRMVVKVQDVLESTGELRASGTLNLTAPEANVDVMTVQVHPGTGQVDTTLY